MLFYVYVLVFLIYIFVYCIKKCQLCVKYKHGARPPPPSAALSSSDLMSASLADRPRRECRGSHARVGHQTTYAPARVRAVLMTGRRNGIPLRQVDYLSTQASGLRYPHFLNHNHHVARGCVFNIWSRCTESKHVSARSALSCMRGDSRQPPLDHLSVD